MIKKEKNHNEMFGVEGMESSGFYTIGEFSRLCNLSAKQLRYYDKIGLISPAYRDEWTGYRYYTIQQLGGDHRHQPAVYAGFPAVQNQKYCGQQRPTHTSSGVAGP